MTEMVERVARALAVADGMHPEAVSNDEDQTPMWTLYVDDARAAIEAMREPTEDMYQAAWKAEVSCSYTESAHAWAAMIDAALVEPQP